jgi:hypothetical protein
MIIDGEMDAMSAENALFSEITTQMQVNRNSLISYCILLGQTGVAEDITQIVINFVIDLISPLKLSLPEWVNKDE